MIIVNDPWNQNIEINATRPSSVHKYDTNYRSSLPGTLQTEAILEA